MLEAPSDAGATSIAARSDTAICGPNRRSKRPRTRIRSTDKSMNLKSGALKYLDVALQDRDCESAAAARAEKQIAAPRPHVDVAHAAFDNHICCCFIRESARIGRSDDGIIGILPKAAAAPPGRRFGGKKIRPAGIRFGLGHETSISQCQQPRGERWSGRALFPSRRESENRNAAPSVRSRRQRNEADCAGSRLGQDLGQVIACNRVEIRIVRRRTHRFEPGQTQHPTILQMYLEPLVDRGDGGLLGLGCRTGGSRRALRRCLRGRQTRQRCEEQRAGSASRDAASSRKHARPPQAVAGTCHFLMVRQIARRRSRSRSR